MHDDVHALDDDAEQVDDDELIQDELPPPRRKGSRRARRPTSQPGGTHAGDVLAGKYMVERVRGQVGGEVVVLARHLELGKRVLLRYLLPEAAQSPELVARFQRGARRAREMKSEQAERVIDFGRLASGSPYRVTELPSGPSLEDIVRVRGAVSVSEAVDIVMAAAEPVAEAHAAGVMHGRLHMSNVFVGRREDGSQHVTVLDFGVSDPLQPDTLYGGSVFGAENPPQEVSFAFAAPEQIRNPAAVSARADVWALGAILYELLTGVRAFEAETPVTLLAMIAADQPTPIRTIRADLPEELEMIVFSCLEKAPERRLRSVVDLATLLAPFGTQESAAVLARIGRLVTRSTHPPSFQSSLPAPPPSSRALATSHPTAPPAEPRQAGMPGWSLVVFGLLIGTCAALFTLLVVRENAPRETRAASPSQPAPLSTETVAAAPVAPTTQPTVTPATVAAPAVALPAPATAPVLASPSPPKNMPPRRAAASPERAKPSAPRERTVESAKVADSKTSRASAGEKAPASLFGGVD